MRVADMHCDTISQIYKKKISGEDCSLLENELHIDLVRMKRGGYLLQNFAAYVDLGEHKNSFEYCMELIDCFYQEMAAHEQYIRPVRSWEDIVKNLGEERISALLSIEEGGVCQGNIRHLRNFYRLGVRMMTLTWNYPNELAYPNCRWDKRGRRAFYIDETNGLTPTGEAFVREMDAIGMIIDVSHLSDGGFWDIIRYTSKPFVASHSNARALCNHPRNLSDEMIRALAERGGVMGLNYFSAFLTDRKYPQGPASLVADMARHARHIADTGGIECLGLGSDFDGIVDTLEMSDCSQMELLFEALKRAGFHESEIDFIFYKNVFRLYQNLL